MKTYTYHVSGTHCASCKILIEDVLSEQDFVMKSSVDIKNEIVEIQTSSNKNKEEIAEIVTLLLKEHGYTLSIEKKKEEKNVHNEIWKALPIGIIFLVLFFMLQKSGILNFGIGGGVTPTTSFLIGVVASLSSCLAIVGGLVLSLSAKVMEDNKNNKRPLVLFHVGRVVGFAILGGILGLIGEAVGISFVFSGILGIVASLVMITLGANLVGIFKKSTITLPSSLFSFFRKVEHETYTPLLIGVGTFFLPCGFTQSMQINALSSGSFVSGLLIMLSFVLGTFPMLALVSFGSMSFAKSKYAPLFFKSAGVVVIGLGIFSLLAGLAGLGIIKPLFNI
jgi:sulfite exporter TauE/SafE/copper chaperone CopZ